MRLHASLSNFKTDHLKIAIFYPWDDIGEYRGGASRRMGYLLQFLSEKQFNIRVLSISDRSDQKEGNIEYLFHRFNFPLVRRVLGKLFLGLIYLATHGRVDEGRVLWEYYRYYLDPGFNRQVEEIVRQADIVFLEYPFWFEPVYRACRQHNVKLILTDYDVIACQVTIGAWLKNKALNKEMDALKKADRAICVSAIDQQFFKNHGIDVDWIPHPIDIKKINAPSQFELCSKSVKIILSDSSPFCLFVGGNFFPNKPAVQIIRRIANSLPDVRFVIVGDCAPPEQQKKYISLGRVSEDELHALYQSAYLVLIPLLSGTGASLKTIESLGYGKVVIGTQVGFRGYAVENGIHCMISNNFEKYPSMILDLINNPLKHSGLSENARKFAQQFDYHILFNRYLFIIDQMRQN
jgi:glycosyltransferase involved in cell wall biosynthesis